MTLMSKIVINIQRIDDKEEKKINLILSKRAEQQCVA
jgi:hypothetical protein